MIHANLNINGAKRRAAFPTAGLQAIVYDQTYEDGGTTYLRTSTGVGIPLVSGAGLDAIWDFSVLNDTRFDKGSYVGNAFGLPEYYNFPYVGIYYDATSEATRYHWKITDFGYAVILAQSLLVDNMFFLKTTATTNTSNVIASWDRLFIYSTALDGVNLSKMKTYIGIQNKFTIEKFTTSNAASDPNGNESNSTNGIVSGSNRSDISSITDPSVGDYAIKDTALFDSFCRSEIHITGKLGFIYDISIDAKRCGGTTQKFLAWAGFSNFITKDIDTDTYKTYIYSGLICNATNIIIRIYSCGLASGQGGVVGDAVCFDNISIKENYTNFYAS